MKLMLTIARSGLIAATFLGIFSVPGLLDAQETLGIDFRNFRRAKLWTGLMNSGQHGPDRDAMRRSEMEGITYPGRNRLEKTGGGTAGWGYTNEGGGRWSGANTWRQELLLRTSVGRNLGTYIIVRPNPAEYQPEDGNTFVTSFSGLTSSLDIVPMSYPIEEMPEGKAGVGFQNRHPTSQVPMANWWAGEPRLSADAVVEIHNFDFEKYMNAEHKQFGELLGIAHWTTETGITATKKIYQWSFRDYDDFIIVENIFENTGDSDGDGIPDMNGGIGLTLNDTYFAFYNYLIPTEGGTSNWETVDEASGYQYWQFRRDESEDYSLIADDVYRYTEATNYMVADPNHGDLAEAIGLKMSYVFDWDSPTSTWDDVGDPHITSISLFPETFVSQGTLLAGQYAGIIPIDYDPTDGFANDTEIYISPRVAEQPFAAPWFPWRDDPEIARHNEDEIARALTSVHLPGERPSMFNLEGRTPFPDNPTEPLSVPDNPSRSAETLDTPASPNWYTFSHTYGPYDLKPGDKVKIVIAYVAGMPVEENIWGWQTNVPQNQADLKTDKAMRNLIKHAKAAKEIYDLEFDVPLPPPDPIITVRNTPNATSGIRWKSLDDLVDPDYAGTPEAKDVAGYRVYQGDFYVDDWKLLKDIPAGDQQHYDSATDSYFFEDETSGSGFDYYYAVTVYDTGHNDFKGRGPVSSLESGLAGVSQIFRYQYQTFSPQVGASVEADRLERKVAVVPNPFLDDGSHAYGGTDKLRFLHLPHKANIKIYNVSGSLVAEFNHDNSNLGEADYFQFTNNVTGKIPAGVYFFVVESLAQEGLGETQSGAFVVVGGKQ
jgi:hypothetical protein